MNVSMNLNGKTFQHETANPLSYFNLADCPWPPSGQTCSECAIYVPFDTYGACWDLWGEKSGDANNKCYYGQTTCINTNSTVLNGFSCIVSRSNRNTVVDPVPDGDGMLLGIVSWDVMTDPNLFFDTNNWNWVGYLATMPKNATGFLCPTTNITLDPNYFYYFVAVTNGSYEESGWQICGFAYDGFPDALPLWKITYVPGQYTVAIQNNMHKLCMIPYQTSSQPLLEGFAVINNPDFPSSVNEGTTYNASFDIDQLTAFPCGCPETVIFAIFDRDTNTQIGDTQGMSLDCGYTGIGNITIGINFTGGGMFHGLLVTGHLENDSPVIDDTHEFDVNIIPYPCSHWTNQTDCTSRGCYWYNNSCHDSAPTSCSQLNNSADCNYYGCYWYDNSCHSDPEPQTGLCDYISNKGGPSGLTLSNVFEVIDAYLFQTPPSGYSFIPTIQNVFGVIDYYLGFDGDDKTGCNFF